MVAILVRWISTIIAVVIAVIVSATLGDSGPGKILAAILIATTIALIEGALIWTPKHFAAARKLLDPRSKHVGFWLQNVKRTVSTVPWSEERNNFAVYWVDYESDGYHIVGFAYDGSGKEFARWASEGGPDFGPDGHSMTYRWKGEAIGVSDPNDPKADIKRTGVTTISLARRTGQVDHVGMSRILYFDVEPISMELLKDLGLAIKPHDLREVSKRDAFARAYAQQRRRP